MVKELVGSLPRHLIWCKMAYGISRMVGGISTVGECFLLADMAVAGMGHTDPVGILSFVNGAVD